MGSPNGIINLLKGIGGNVFNGVDLHDGKKWAKNWGVWRISETLQSTGCMTLIKSKITRQFEMLAQLEQMEYDECARVGAFLYITMLMDDCLERNRSVCGGGVRYLGGTLETYGNINTVNSLYAIRTLVYEEKKIAPQRLLDALRANFQGYEAERQMLCQAEKYGNDLDGVDALAQDFTISYAQRCET